MRPVFRRVVLALLVLAPLLSGPSMAAEVLRIGYQKYGTLVLLKARGTLEQALRPQGVEIRWVEFPGGPQLLEGLNAGGIDFGVTGETPPVFAQAAGADLVYVANEPPAPTSEAIVVRRDSSIRSVADLKGRKVALNKGSNVHYLLLRALQDAGLRYSDIRPVYLAPADARAAFESGSIDAWAIWDPYFAAAEQQLQARVLRDGRKLVDNTQFYLATRTYAQKYPQRISTLVQQIRDVGAWAKANPAEAARQSAPLLGLTPPVAEVVVRRQGFGASFITPQVTAAQQRIADAFAREHLIPKPLNVSQVVWTTAKVPAPGR